MDTNTINKGKSDEKLILLKINLLTESVFLNGWEVSIITISRC